MTIRSTIRSGLEEEATPHRPERRRISPSRFRALPVAIGLLLAGSLLIVSAVSLDTKGLENPLAPLHIALAGVFTGLILAALYGRREGREGVPAKWIFALTALEAVMAVTLGLLQLPAGVFWITWVVLLGLGVVAALSRAGPSSQGLRSVGEGGV